VRFYTGPHQHWCGIDLHAKTMYVCILDREGQVLVHRNLPSSPEAFLAEIEPYRDGLVVAVECIFTWYWLADLCAREGIAFVLGHALYMKAIHGGKAKNDRIDALKIATLLRGGMLPQAYAYPASMRATRDLLRRRLHLVRKRGQLLAHIQMTSHQYNLPPLGKRIAYPSNREGVADHFRDRVVKKSIAVDLALLDRYDALITDLELYLVRQAKQHDPNAFHRLRTIPGVGKVLALTILYEIQDVHRFDRVQQFASYARLVKCAKESAGKKQGTSGAKMGNVHLKWAFSEAALLFVRHCAEGKQMLARLEKRHGKGKALSILAHKLGRAAYFLLAREDAFDVQRFVATAN
jgi:transposase